MNEQNLSNQSKKVKKEMQILYFFGIVMVVASHCNLSGFTLLNKWFPVSSCQLAIFAFGAGYFYLNNQNKTTKEVIIHKIKKIVIPFFAWNLIYGVIATILKEKFGFAYFKTLNLNNYFLVSLYSGHQFILNLGSWFLVPLFLLNIVGLPILRILEKKENRIYLIVLFAFLLGMIGINLAMRGYYKGWWLFLIRFLYFLPFFTFGLLYKIKLEKNDTCKNTVYFGVIFLFLLAILISKERISSYYPATCDNFDNSYLPFVIGILGIAFWLRISKILTPILKNSKIVQKIGENTFSIMMHHLTGFFLLNCFFEYCSRWGLIHSFNSIKFHQEVWYYYLPKNISNFYVFYFIAGFSFSFFIVWIEKKVKHKLKKECM